MKHLLSTFIHHFIGDRTTDAYKRPACWLINGQPMNGRKGGHTVWVQYWTVEEAAVLWDLIRLTLELRALFLTHPQRAAYKRRQDFIEEHFKLNVLELIVQIA